MSEQDTKETSGKNEVIETKVVPEKIKNKIHELKKLETLLGHLPSEVWKVDELQKRIVDPSHQHSVVQMDVRTEILFAEICDDLSAHHFNHEEIATAINDELCHSLKIKYCNSIEVKEALGV